MRKRFVIPFLKNIILFGALFIILSTVMDWYRKPSAPVAFAQQVLIDTHNEPKMIAQLSYDKPMLLYFWGSWCGFCSVTSPAVQQLKDDGVEVIGVALRSGSDEEVNHYLQEKGYHFATINDPDGAFSKNWGIQATPTLLIIKNGEIINHTTGFSSYWGLKLRLWLANLI